MRIALLGATGRTGHHVLRDALSRGMAVSALVRDPDRLPADLREHPALRVVAGTATDGEALTDVLAGADAVVSALGPTAKEGDLHTRVARLLVERLGPDGRMVGISGAGVDAPGDRKTVLNRVISAVIMRVGGAVVQDKPAELAVLLASPLRWTLVRPPRLVDGPATTGDLEHDAHRSTRSTQVRRADLARFLVDVVEQGLYVRSAPFVATPRGAR